MRVWGCAWLMMGLRNGSLLTSLLSALTLLPPSLPPLPPMRQARQQLRDAAVFNIGGVTGGVLLSSRDSVISRMEIHSWITSAERPAQMFNSAAVSRYVRESVRGGPRSKSEIAVNLYRCEEEEVNSERGGAACASLLLTIIPLSCLFRLELSHSSCLIHARSSVTCQSHVRSGYSFSSLFPFLAPRQRLK